MSKYQKRVEQPSIKVLSNANIYLVLLLSNIFFLIIYLFCFLKLCFYCCCYYLLLFVIIHDGCLKDNKIYRETLGKFPEDAANASCGGLSTENVNQQISENSGKLRKTESQLSGIKWSITDISTTTTTTPMIIAKKLKMNERKEKNGQQIGKNDNDGN